MKDFERFDYGQNVISVQELIAFLFQQDILPHAGLDQNIKEGIKRYLNTKSELEDDIFNSALNIKQENLMLKERLKDYEGK